MAQPLRKIFQKNLLSGAEASAPQGRRERPARQEGAGERRKAATGPRRRTLDLSGAAATALGLALACAVGWAFFMGYLVGRGEHPRRGVENVAGLILPQGSGGAAARRAPLPGEEALLPAREGTTAPEAAGAPEGAKAPGAPLPTPPQAQASPVPAPAAAPLEGAPPQPQAPAYPFTRPEGEGLAAWGIRPEASAPPAQGVPPQGAAGQRQAARQAATAATAGKPVPATAKKNAEPPRPAEPRFDYVFQAAAFKGPMDAERLRGRLEAAGLRAKVRPSGKVRLVVVSLRGGAEDARRVRGTLAGLGLGRPVLLEKTPVTEKAGGKGRRRSAP